MTVAYSLFYKDEGCTPSKVEGQEFGVVWHCGAICMGSHSHSKGPLRVKLMVVCLVTSLDAQS
jgi:hypothetical protein